MKKAWIVFALILIISGQLLALSLFREIDDNGFAVNNSVITVAKWNYVGAMVTVSIYPMVENGTINTQLILPNGTAINITSPYGFTQRFSFPRTGDFVANAAFSGPIALSQDKPLTVLIESNVGNVQDYISSLSTMKIQNANVVDILNFIVYGEAQVSINVYGVIT